MMSRLRPLYLISANTGCKIDLSEIASLIPADIEVYIVSLCDGTIYEAYHFDPDNPIVRGIAFKDEAMGIWIMKTNQSIWMRRKNMDGLKIYGKGFRPLIFDQNDPKYHAMMISDRYAVDVWNDLTEFLNFTLVIIEGSIENDTKNSTPWDGMIGLLGSQEIDVPTNLVTVTERAAEGYAMKATVFTASFRLMFHSPLSHKHMLMPNVLHPFDEKLWLALVFMVFLILPSILALLLRKETEFGNAAILPLRCLASQGLGFSPMNTSARFGCLVTLFFCYLMVMYYQSLLITFLTSSHQYQPFSTLEEFYSKSYGFDLIYHKDMSWALLGDWQRSTSETSDPISKLALGVDPPKRNRVLPMSSRAEAGKRLCRFASNTTIFDVPFRQAPLIRCPYSTTKHKYLLMHFGIGARHNLSAYPYITRMIRDMEEYGIIDRMKQSFRLTQYKSTFKSLSHDELGTVLVSYHFAMLFCIFLLVMELLWFHGCKFYMLKFSGKNKKVRRRYHNKRMNDLQKVLDLHNEFKKSK
ncbi:uncharacterized protein LOC111046905 [Nilaparvata lugens]|uniref:uncharacterized protein LOC111046905 n=1 Tax=Nilaparvata lugens TaxID=108931 RepID=UPI00193E4A6D|nr:uncharacterized protein LOC111046905 [Nilaparvata lugens]